MTVDAGAPQAPASAPPAAPKVNTFERLVGAVTAPTRTFEDVARRPDVLLPLLIFFILGVVFVVAMVPHIDFETSIRDSLEQSGRKMSEADIDRSVRFGAAFAKAFMYAAPILGIGWYLLIAAILLMTFRMIGADGNYTQALSATLYASVPMLIKSIITMVVLSLRGTVSLEQLGNVVMSHPGVLVDPKASPVLFALLSSFEIFTIWMLVLLIIGFSYVARASKAKSAAVVLSWWGLLTFIRVGWGAWAAAMAAKAKRS